MIFDHVFRYRTSRYGQRCRILALSPISRDRLGKPIHHCGEESCAVEFEDGTREEVRREQLLRADSALGRRVVQKAKEVRT